MKRGANLAVVLGAVCIVARGYTLERAHSEQRKAKQEPKPRLPKWGIVVAEA